MRDAVDGLLLEVARKRSDGPDPIPPVAPEGNGGKGDGCHGKPEMADGPARCSSLDGTQHEEHERAST